MATTILILYLLLIPTAVIAYSIAQRKALKWEAEDKKLSCRPNFYGWYLTLWSTFPPAGALIFALLLHSSGVVSIPSFMLFFIIALLVLVGMLLGISRLNHKFKARHKVEKYIKMMLMMASLISILTTICIIFSILFEALTFFKHVSIIDFLTGTEWNPDAMSSYAEASGEVGVHHKFGAIPLFSGTFLITFIAMVVAVPVGLFSAIYLSEYATTKIRKTVKPLLEILAGIPTVVYGFFAAVTVSPLVVSLAEKMNLSVETTNALSPGIVMGIMIIPFMSSLSDDVICSVPSSLRDGGLALGTTKSETIKYVILPAAMPGLVSAFLLSVSRAVGETMIVVMAAGLRPNLTMNPLEGVTTVTVRIVDALTGDQAFDSLETLSAFGLSLVLLVMTLGLNFFALMIVKKFHKKYE